MKIWAVAMLRLLLKGALGRTRKRHGWRHSRGGKRHLQPDLASASWRCRLNSGNLSASAIMTRVTPTVSLINLSTSSVPRLVSLSCTVRPSGCVAVETGQSIDDASHDSSEKRFLPGKVRVNRRLAGRSQLCNLVHTCALVAFLKKDALSRIEDSPFDVACKVFRRPAEAGVRSF